MANLAPTWRPKTFQNRGRNLKKLMLKNDMFLASIFEGFGPCFGRVFGMFFGAKMHENRKHTILAKTVKIMIFHRENTHFQEIED